MDVVQFQEKLNEICVLAEKNKKSLTAEQIRTCFQDMSLEKEQLLKVLQYLKGKGITLEGIEETGKSMEAQADGSGVPGEEAQHAVPLTPEEEIYLAEYKKGLDAGADASNSHYLELAADMAVQMNCREISLADLIQEANVVLFTILSQSGKDVQEEEQLRGQLYSGIRQVIEEQTQRKFEDDYLVAKVQNLEAAMKELTEDEEEGAVKFSINELAVILDMDVEEIRDVLRLTGDDK